MDDVEALGRDDLALNLIAMAPTCSLGCLGVLAHYSHHDNDDKRLMPSHDENQLAIPIEIDLGLVHSFARSYVSRPTWVCDRCCGDIDDSHVGWRPPLETAACPLHPPRLGTRVRSVRRVSVRRPRCPTCASTTPSHRRRCRRRSVASDPRSAVTVVSVVLLLLLMMKKKTRVHARYSPT